jgi:hypothetical protein
MQPTVCSTEGAANLKGLELKQGRIKPLVFEELWQQRNTEIKIFAAQLKLAQQKEAKRFIPQNSALTDSLGRPSYERRAS